MPGQITYTQDLDGVDWEEMKATLVQDDFDNGRTPEQLRESFANSSASIIAYAPDGRIIGTVRALSDGVCNAYVVDVWTLTEFRKQGVATRMMQILLDRFEGQHGYLFTDDTTVAFYKKLGFEEQGIGLARVVGQWLRRGMG